MIIFIKQLTQCKGAPRKRIKAKGLFELWFSCRACRFLFLTATIYNAGGNFMKDTTWRVTALGTYFQWNLRAEKANQSKRFVRVVVLAPCMWSSCWHLYILQRRRNLATFLENLTRHSVRHILPMKCARRENEKKQKMCSSCSARVVHVVFFLAALHFRTQREPL